MCDPVTIASMAATVGGSLLQANAASGAQSRANDAVAAERIRQNALRDRAAGFFQKSLDTSGRPAVDQRMDDAVAKRTAAYQGVVPTFDANRDLTAGQRDASPVVRGAIESSLAAGAQKARDQGALRALNDAWGDQKLGQGIDLTRNRNDIATTSNLATGSANVLPLEVNAAKMSGKSGIGDLLVGLGQVGAMAKGGLGTSAPTWGGVGRFVSNPLPQLNDAYSGVSGAFSRFFGGG